MRVPGIMRWPARIPAGRVVSEPVSTLDLFPTLVTLTGAELPSRPYDGQDVSRLLTGEVDRIGGQGIDGGREIVFWQQDGVGGLRSGRWKYLRPGTLVRDDDAVRPRGRPRREERPEPRPGPSWCGSSTSG